MSSKHDRYVRAIDIDRLTGGADAFTGGSATPISGQVAASAVYFSPSGGVQAGNVQGAIQELDAEKLALTGGTMTGLLILSGTPTVDLGAATKWYVDNLDKLLVPDATGVPIVRLLPDFVRIGHPLQPGLTWTPEQGLQIPASTITGLLDRFTTYIAAPTGGALGTAGAVHYVPAATRVGTIAVAVGENTGDGVTMLVLAAASLNDLLGTEPSAVIGRVTIPTLDRDVVGAAEDFVIDGDTGDYVTLGVNYVVSGDDPMIPAGYWLGVWDGTNMDFLTDVTVTILGRRA